MAALVGRDRGVECRCEDPLVLGKQVVCELVEVADAANHRSGRHDLIAVGGKLREERHVLGVALNEPVARVVVIRLGQAPVLAEVVHADDVVARSQQLGDEVAIDEPGSTGYEILMFSVGRLRHRTGRTGSGCPCGSAWTLDGTGRQGLN